MAPWARRGCRNAMVSSKLDMLDDGVYWCNYSRERQSAIGTFVCRDYVLDDLIYLGDWIAWADGTSSQNPGVKPAQTPARTGRVAVIHLCVENGVLNSWVDVERGAGSAPLG